MSWLKSRLCRLWTWLKANVPVFHALLTGVLVVAGVGVAYAAAALFATAGPQPKEACKALKASAICFEFAGSAKEAWARVENAGAGWTRPGENIESLRAQIGADDGFFIPFYIVLYLAVGLWAITATPRRPLLGITVIVVMAAVAALDYFWENRATEHLLTTLEAHVLALQGDSAAPLPVGAQHQAEVLLLATRAKWSAYGVLLALAGVVALRCIEGSWWSRWPAAAVAWLGATALACGVAIESMRAVEIGFVSGFIALVLIALPYVLRTLKRTLLSGWEHASETRAEPRFPVRPDSPIR